SIQVQGANVTLTDDSVMLIQNQGLQPAGNLSVHASESLQLLDPMPSGAINSGIFNETVGIGNGGDIEVITQRLVVQDGASIQARTFSTATGGNITVNASKSAQVVGFSPLNSTAFSSISTSALNSGGVGKLIVSTERLTVLDGGAVISTTFGAGNAGDVIVKATESIEVSGAEPSLLVPSLIASTTLYNGLDQEKGNAGNVRIDTRQLLVRDGGRVDSSTLASGNAGSVIINASESVKVSGRFPGSVNPSLIISSANIVDPVLRKALGLPDQPSGDSGNVTINTPHLSVTDGAQVTVRNDGTGKAGTLTINADSILLNNQGGITASTNAGESAQEGSITLNVRNSLQMRHNSVISADARGQQRGGNITINAGAIAAVPKENSDITASAPQGTGGKITINTQGIFGTQFRPNLTPESDITAFGDPTKAQSNGIVQVNTPEINVQAALNQLNGNFITTEQAIASSCFARRNVEQGTFTVTGTGGLPTTPYDAIGGRYAVTQVQGLPNSARQQTSSPTPNPVSPPAQSWKLGDPIQEAQGMSVTPDGRIIVGTNPQLAAIADPQTLICHLTIRPKAESRGQKG
ncbi:MAG TPA: S-layer family protein, partial [Allocoleopsis sp.]